MSDFNLAIPATLKHEGLFSDDPTDTGGPTNYGVSLRFLKGLGADGDINNDGVVDIKDIKALTLDSAKKLYRDNFWTKYGYGKIASQPIASKCFDMCVNMGPISNKLFQRAANTLLAPKDKLSEDGLLGPKSFAAFNSLPPSLLMTAICAAASSYYQAIVAKKPDHKKYLKGWLNRASVRCGL